MHYGAAAGTKRRRQGIEVVEEFRDLDGGARW